MEAWQRIGTYAAGLALDSAGVKGNKEILGRMDMIVAAGGGERDLAVDCDILKLEAKGNSAPGFLNERLMNDLRPTLFLAQLSNLLAGNIAIVHGVTGSSRTFMGEEAAGVDAARIALARIAAGQSDIALVGGSQNGERKDLLVLYEFGDFNLKAKFAPVWSAPGQRRLRARVRRRVSCHGIQGARASARRQTLCAPDQRGRRPRTRKQPGEVTQTLEKLWSKLGRLDEQRRDHHGGDRRRAGDIGRTGVPRRASAIRGARNRHDVRSHHGNPVSAGTGAGRTFDLARRAVSA